MKQLIFTILISSIFFFSCKNIQKESANEPAAIGLIHTVFFWMNDSLTAEDHAFFEAELQKLGTMPEIVKYYIGTPAGTEDRGVVDNSYTYAWIVHFANPADQETYQVHPLHVEFVENCKHLWYEVKVYDTVLKP